MNRQAAESAKRERPEPSAELDALTHATIGAALEVHRVLGPGLLESLYEEAFCVELRARRIAFARQVPVPVLYKGESLGEARLDVLVGGQLVVELKAVDALAPIHVAQVLCYSKLTRARVGLLMNFNVRELRDGMKRIISNP